ncbi:MAG: transglutaminase-like domain-containing protein [Bacteroides sp.]|nr:transglutaminase-like domain-containing protein [Bacteroides sp.]
MKKYLSMLFAAVFFFAALTSAVYPCGASYLDETGDLSRLVTSNYENARAVIDVSGDDIKISGVYSEDLPKSIDIEDVDETKNHFHVESDGRFTGEITAAPLEDGYYDLTIHFSSRLIYRYTLKYHGGWSVPDNGIAKANEEKLRNIVTAAPMAAAYYLSAEADREEIEETLTELEAIVHDACGDETDDYLKARALILWIGEHIFYDHDAAETSVTMDTVAVHNVLERRRTTCAGFANTFSALLEIAGIRSVNLKGAAVAGEIEYPALPTGTENHEFSAFWYEAEERWVLCDACWTSNGSYRGGEYFAEITNGTKYFDVSSEAFALNHRIDKAEERFYTQALTALGGEASETEGSESSETAEASEEQETSRSSEEANDNTEPKDTAAPAAETPTVEHSSDGEEKNNILPYVIIGVLGIAALCTGIILAVGKRKR